MCSATKPWKVTRSLRKHWVVQQEHCMHCTASQNFLQNIYHCTTCKVLKPNWQFMVTNIRCRCVTYVNHVLIDCVVSSLALLSTVTCYRLLLGHLFLYKARREAPMQLSGILPSALWRLLLAVSLHKRFVWQCDTRKKDWRRFYLLSHCIIDLCDSVTPEKKIEDVFTCFFTA